jgi:hypothetical protein
MDALPKRIAGAVAEAAQRLAPARAAWGRGEERGVSFNRRYRMRDGTVRMNPGALNPEIVEPAGPIDPEVGVLWIEGRDGAPLAVLTNFALHYIGTDDASRVSADYFGHYARWMQRIYGAGLVPILLNGAQGDINGVDVHLAGAPKGHAWAHKVAGILAGDTLSAVERLRASDDVTLGARTARVPFRRKRITAEDLAIAERILAVPDDVPAADLRRAAGLDLAGPFSWVVGQPLPDAVLRVYARECRHLAAMPEEMETEVQALRVGGGAIVGLPGEPFVELGLAIKQASPFGRATKRPGVTMVVALANDYVGYIATRRAIEQEGSYETWAARSALPAAGTGEAMVEAATGLLSALAANP